MLNAKSWWTFGIPADVRQGAATAPLVPGASRLTGISEQIMRDEQFKQAWPAVRSGAVASHSVENAPVAKKLKKFAVLMFSPGLGSATFAYTSQLEEFASHGYLVAAIEHTYDTPYVIFQDGRVVPFAKDLRSQTPEPTVPGGKGEEFHRQRTKLWAEQRQKIRLRTYAFSIWNVFTFEPSSINI